MRTYNLYLAIISVFVLTWKSKSSHVPTTVSPIKYLEVHNGVVFEHIMVPNFFNHCAENNTGYCQEEIWEMNIIQNTEATFSSPRLTFNITRDVERLHRYAILNASLKTLILLFGFESSSWVREAFTQISSQDISQIFLGG